MDCAVRMTHAATPEAVSHAAKRLARLAAVQAIYQSVFAQQPLEQIIRDALDSGFESLNDGEANAAAVPEKPDVKLFVAIVQGVASHQEAMDEAVAAALDKKVSADRLEMLLRAILRAGAFEIRHHDQIPAGVVINDYVDVAHAFFNGKEPGLVNGVLDKLAGKLR